MTADVRRRGSNRALAVIVSTILAWCPPASAWNAAGHRLTASIAWDLLLPAAQEEAVSLLRSHPDYERWISRPGSPDIFRRAFIEASTWPDEIRKDKRFYSANKEEPTPALPGFPDMERHGNWHYVNIPLDGSPEGKALSGQLGRRLPELVKLLRESTDETERSYALPWLIHLVGDAHQPLHTSARVNKLGKWDRLGNNVKVNNPYHSRKPLMTLHSFWDDLPGPRWLRGERLDLTTRELLANYPRPPRSTSGQQWIRESWTLAREHGYPVGEESIPVITEAFFDHSTEIANQRVTEAGYRLADVLNEIFATGKRTQR